ncbi:MAG: iron-sulfur cluster assembly protein [Chloroflexi bacterium]|nr:iron-sulfur cluster assembly protein [Chloroflexota bacterium]
MNLAEQTQLYQAIIERLQNVIDPETGADVIRMRLVDDLVVESDGKVSYTFRPSSPLCPIAVYLVQQIKQAVAELPGVVSQYITVEDYVQADELTQLINQE